MFFKTKYDLIVSIGEACPCSQALRDRKLQRFSYPFDWLYGGNFSDRVELILSDFNTFLAIEDLNKTGSREYPEPCDIYTNTRNHLVFNHDFPVGVPLSESFEIAKAKYDRRIERFISAIRSAQNVLMVYVEIPNTPNPPISCTTLENEHRSLTEKFQGTTIDILYLSHRSNISKKHTKIVKINSNVSKVELYYQNDSAETIWEVDMPVLVRQLKKYALNRNSTK